MASCNGDGNCLVQTGLGGNEYEQSTCVHNCIPKPCPNYPVCGTVAPQWVLDCNHDHCMNCAIFGWKLKFKYEIECPVCLDERNIGVTNPNCEHAICIPCFKRMYYGEDLPQPSLPSDLDEEYYADPDNEKWDHHEVIVKYRRECDLWEDKKDLQYEREEHLRRCPLCRK